MHSSLASPTGHWKKTQKSLDMAYWKYTGSYFRASVVLVDVVVEKILQKYQVMICIHLYLHLGDSKKRGTPKSYNLLGFPLYKPSILVYPYFRKPPFSCRLNMLRIFLAWTNSLPRRKRLFQWCPVSGAWGCLYSWMDKPL